MSGLWVLFLIILASAIPLIVVCLWFRVMRYPFTPARFVLFLLAGASAYFPALFLQRLIPAELFPAQGRWALLLEVFVRIAFTEELSRFLMLLLVYRVFRKNINPPQDALSPPSIHLAPPSIHPAPPPAYSEASRAAAAGLVAGLGFAAMESAVFGASRAGLLLLRAVTAAPLHGACGARVGLAASLFRARPGQALFSLVSAAAIHGVYNFMIGMPGFPVMAAVLIAFSALGSSVMLIRGGSPGRGGNSALGGRF